MKELHQYYVYLLTNKLNSVIYIGVTSDIKRRTWQHKEGNYVNAFTKRYGCSKLVYYETYQWVQKAIEREKQLKAGSRQTKVDLINKDNPGWHEIDLWD